MPNCLSPPGVWSPDLRFKAAPSLIAAGAVVLAAAAWLLLPAVADFEQVRASTPASTALLLDRHGEVIDALRIDQHVRRWPWTPLAQVSTALPATLIQTEDHRFREHHGVDWRGMAGAIRDTLQGRPRGGSSITMQLATLLERAEPVAPLRWTPLRKLRQLRTAWALERRWSKEQILEAWLNLLPFRGELQGIGAAAAVLAGKAPSGLSIEESRILAALLPAPSASAQAVAARACRRQQQLATAADCAALQAAAVRMLGQRSDGTSIDSLAPAVAQQLLGPQSRSVQTTLDASIQRLARDALHRQLLALVDRNVRDGAALVVDNASGEVLAYVGSSSATSRSRQVDGVRARRQAGSTLKPFLYELALERRYLTAASLLDDSPLTLETRSGVYVPRDYDHDFKGPVTVRTALAGSLNVPAVRSLVLVGVEAFHQRLRDLGYAGLGQDGAWHGYALALGSADVTLWEQAGAYRVLALGGQQRGPLTLQAANVATAPVQLLQAQASWIIADILADKAARAVTFGLANSLATRRWSAVKTGTSSAMRDNWCIGFTPRYTVAVWVGNFEGDAMRNVSGVSGAAPVWRQIVEALDDASDPLPPPPALRNQALRFANHLEPPRREWFLPGTTPDAQVARIDTVQRDASMLYPTDGLIVALDPDIPPGSQRLPLHLQGRLAGLQLLLDDAEIKLHGEITLWTPTRGTHRLRLLDAQGRLIEESAFTVR